VSERLGPPPVEPLSDVAWARVERDIWQRLDDAPAAPARRRAPRALWIAVPTLAAAAVAVVWIATTGSPAAPADDEPSRVVSGAAPSEVSFGDAHVTLDARSSLVMSRAGGRPIAYLERGAAWFAIAPRGERPPFEVHAGDAIVRVVGTRFRVARDGERVDVAVDHGAVEVRFRGAAIRLEMGQTWSSAPVEVTRAAPPHEPAIEIDPVAPRDPRATGGAAPAPHAARPRDPDQQRYEAALALEPTRPDAAIDAYLELSKNSGKWAGNALYAAGRLAADRRDPRARTFLTIYLARFPHGSNVADARALLDRLEGARP
jgi:hypothetical protein